MQSTTTCWRCKCCSTQRSRAPRSSRSAMPNWSRRSRRDQPAGISSPSNWRTRRRSTIGSRAPTSSPTCAENAFASASAAITPPTKSRPRSLQLRARSCERVKISEALARSQARPHVEAETHWGHASRGPNERTCVRSVRQRIGPHLDVYGARLGALAAFLQPRRAVAVRAPQAAALPAGVRVVDAPVQAFGKEAQRVGDAQHDHPSVLERGEPVIEVGGRDGDVLAKPHRVVVVHPGVIARLGGPVLEALKGRARIFVVSKAFGAVVAGRSETSERTLALASIEADESSTRARAPNDAVLVDVAAALTNALFRDRVELAELGLGVEAQESRRAGEYVHGVPDRAVGGVRHHGVGTRAGDPHVLVRLRRLARLGPFVDLTVAVGVEHERRPALCLGGIASLVPNLSVDPASHWAAHAATRKP